MLKEFANLIPDYIDRSKINKIIGTGSEGIVLEYDQDKIFKLTIKPRLHYSKFLSICEHVASTKPKHVMGIYHFGTLNDQYHWYLGEKLSPLKKYEKIEIERNSYSYHRYVSKNIPFKYIQSKTKRLNEFWEFLIQFNYKYNDLWAENVMRTQNKTLKIIDLEGFIEQCH